MAYHLSPFWFERIIINFNCNIENENKDILLLIFSKILNNNVDKLNLIKVK